MNDYASILIALVFVFGGLATFMFGHWLGYRHGRADELEESAQRFHEFRLKKFDYDLYDK